MSESLRTRLPGNVNRDDASVGDALTDDALTDDDLDSVGVADGLRLSFGLGDVFERLWHLLISMRVGLTLILFLSFLALVGTLVEQAPTGLANDSAAYAEWVAGLRSRYGGWTDVLNLLGFYAVFGSVWFKATVVLLTTSLLACSVNRAPRLWRVATRPRVAASAGFLQHAPLTGGLAGDGSVAAAVDALGGALRRQHYRTILAEDPAGVAIYADRFRWGPFGTVIAHLSLIVILAGAIYGMTGFRVTDFAIAVGSTTPVGNGTNLSVLASSFSDSYFDNGTPADYASDLVVYDGDREVARKTVRVNDPLRIGDITFFQSFYGPAADIRVTDTSGATVADQGVPLLWRSNDGTKALGQFAIPGKGLTVWVIGVASGRVDSEIRPGQLQLEVYSAANPNTPVGLALVDQGVASAIAGLDFTFVRERQFTGLIVSRDPGAPLVWLGVILLTLGTVMVFLFPHRRIWARVGPTADGVQVQVAAASRHDASFESSFRSLIEGVRVTLRATNA
jgi:cytochrome c biogenesis protein